MDVSELPTEAWIADIVIGLLAFVSFALVAAWWTKSGISAQEENADCRKAGREAISSQLTVSLTASAILLAASFVVIQIGRSSEIEISDSAVTQVLIAAIALAVSILLTVWNSALIVPLSRDRDVSLNAPTNIISAVALFSLLAGAGFFTVALFLL